MSNGTIPKTIRELHIYLDGEFKEIRTEIKNIRKTTFWIGSLSGGLMTAVLSFIFKIFGGSK